MYYLQACPKCKGDMGLQEDQYGARLFCVQCGHDTYLPVDRTERFIPWLMSQSPATVDSKKMVRQQWGQRVAKDGRRVRKAE